MADTDKQNTEERTGTYGGDDGALEHERALIAPGEDPGAIDLTDGEPQTGTTQAEDKQDKDLKTGEENPG